MGKSIKIKPLAILAVVLLTFSFMSGYSVFYGDVGTFKWKFFYYGKILVVLCFIVISFSNNIVRKSNYEINKTRKMVLSTLLFPLIIIFIYSIILWFINWVKSPFVTRGISDILFRCLAYIGGVSFVYIFKLDAPRYAIYSAILTYISSICIGFINVGGSIIISAINFMDSSQTRYLELHEVAFTIGLYIIFFIFINKKEFIKKTFMLFFLSCFFFYVAGKRIGIAAVFLVVLYGFVINKSKKHTKKWFLKITGVVVTIMCLIYVSLSTSNELVNILERNGISLMGRNIIYNYFRQFCDFNLSYIGQGWGFVSRQFDYTTVDDLYNMISIKALHNDYMKIFIDIGFIGFILWCWYWIRIIPNKISKFVSTEAAYQYMLLILYAFITYTTDNTEGYFNFQMHLSILVATICYSYKLKLKKS